MTDDEIARHNELAKAQREAALNAWERWGNHVSTPEHMARNLIATIYPLLTRVKRENEWVQVSYDGWAKANVDRNGYMRRVTCATQWPGYHTRQEAELIRDGWVRLCAQFDATDTVTKDREWPDA